jgi:N-acetylmuramoyl-L-alanine amidase
MNRTVLLLIAASLLWSKGAAAESAVQGIRFWSLDSATRIVIETTGEFDYKADRAIDPDRLFFDISGARVKFQKRGMTAIPVNDRLVKQIRVGLYQRDVVRVVLDLEDHVEHTASRLSNPDRLVIEVRSGPPLPVPEMAPAASRPDPVVTRSTAARAIRTTPKKFVRPLGSIRVIPKPVLFPPPHIAKEPVYVASLFDPTRARERGSRAVAQARAASLSKTTEAPSLTRVLGLKVGKVVIDAGHGGHDNGTDGPHGLLEKDLVLDVALRLGELVEKRLGAEVVYTRKDDVFIPLHERTAIANAHRADLFLSIHANSSPSDAASGIETFYLNLTSDKYALEVAARENATSNSTVYDLRNLVQKITMNDKADESRQFAVRMQSALYSFAAKGNPRSRDRGVKKAPFVVLIGATMPSVLCEVGFLSNPKDEALLRKSDYRQKLAEALYKGLAGYASTLSHFQIAVRQ